MTTVNVELSGVAGTIVVLAIGAICCCGPCLVCFCACGGLCGTNWTPTPPVRPDGRKVNIGGHDTHVEHLRSRKELVTAYILWLLTGILGTHHYYLDRVVHGFLATWSLNFFTIGWIIDAFLLPSYTRTANKYAVVLPHTDGSCRLLSLRLPLIGLVVMLALPLFWFMFPDVINTVGVVDVDRRIAGTEQNPYDILGIPRRSPREQALAACHEQMRQFEGSACDRECRAKKEELGKVLDFLDGTSWMGEESDEIKEDMGDTWTNRVDFVAAEWQGIIDASLEGIGVNSTESKKKRKKKVRRRNATTTASAGKDRTTASSQRASASKQPSKDKDKKNKGGKGVGRFANTDL